jgi:hypothetical protein
MAGLNVAVNFSNVACVVGSWKTICGVTAPTGSGLQQMLRVKSFSLAFDGTDGVAKPLEYRLVRATISTGTNTTATAYKLCNSFGATPRTVGHVNYTVEPTYGGSAIDDTTPQFFRGLVHPQGGVIREVTFDEVIVEHGTDLVLQVKIPSAGSIVNATGCIVVEE